MQISACGAIKDEWLDEWNIPESDRDRVWAEKLALDEKVAAQASLIRGNVGVIADIQPYRSQIDGSIIESRTKHRNHLKQHGCIEVGNEKQQPKKREEPKGLRDAIGRAVYQRLG